MGAGGAATAEPKALTGHARGDVGGDVTRARELAQPCLRRDLPR